MLRAMTDRLKELLKKREMENIAAAKEEKEMALDGSLMDSVRRVTRATSGTNEKRKGKVKVRNPTRSSSRNSDGSSQEDVTGVKKARDQKLSAHPEKETSHFDASTCKKCTNSCCDSLASS